MSNSSNTFVDRIVNILVTGPVVRIERGVMEQVFKKLLSAGVVKACPPKDPSTSV
jgi:hypothetical protein